jgi:hypothetical protein
MKAEGLRLMDACTPTSSSSEQVQAQENSVAPAVLRKKSAAQTDLWIFRDGKKSVSGPQMLRNLQHRVSSAASDPGYVLDALIEAGELEAALADVGSLFAETAARLTDVLALALCGGTFDSSEALDLVSQIQPTDRVKISPPEGFTYYALHPSNFARVIAEIPEHPRECALIGIRSIGTTLSAVTNAALKQAGRKTSRITVRPTGHPYSRHNEFSAQQLEWIRGQFANGAQFLIVDEGPGRSGSTFLSVAESLLRAGVPASLITLIGSRQLDPASLCVDDAVSRWSAFKFVATIPSVNARFANCIYVGGGNWRGLTGLSPWPEIWPQMERLKFLSRDRKRIYKFEGMGPLGADVRERAFLLAKAGLAPRVTDAGDGFLEYEWLHGKPVTTHALTASLLDRMAEYCAFRASNFVVRRDDDSDLLKMLKFNVQREFGLELRLADDAFAAAAPIIADGRMQPHEWIPTSKGEILKTDGISHGDDHFFPGPCDVTWDLAGIAVEWRLDRDAIDYLAGRFQSTSGRDVSAQMNHYMLAYAVFRLGYCKMAISTVAGTAEEQRLRMGYRRYREQAAFQSRQLSAHHRSIHAS